MALHTKWSSGDLIFYDGTQDIMTIKNGTDGVEFDVNITMGDGDPINFGASDDIVISWTTGGVFEVLPDAANSDMYLGSSGYPLDVVNYGNITHRDPTTVNSTSDITLIATNNRTQFVDSCGQSISLTLPAIADCAGIEFKIANFSTGGTITVYSTDGSSIQAMITVDEVGLLLCDGVTWGACVSGKST